MVPASLIQSLPTPQETWQDITMDFIIRLPSAHVQATIMVVVDIFAKYAHFIAMPPSLTVAFTASIFISKVCCYHGLLKTIISDRDKIFLSAFWQALLKETGTKLHYSIAHYSQTNSQTEVINRSLEQYLHYYVMDNPKWCPKFIPWAACSYNTSLYYWHFSHSNPFMDAFHHQSSFTLAVKLATMKFIADLSIVIKC